METIIDKYLEKILADGLNQLPCEIVLEMADLNQAPTEEWRIWHPIQSQVTDEEIKAFELRIGHQLPLAYQRFLKHKHFYALQIGDCEFCEHPSGQWRAALAEMIFNGYPKAFLLDKGKIPFANWSDWGLLCFDTTTECQNNDYPIVLWDHEVAEAYEPKYPNFEMMMKTLDQEESQSHSL